MGRLTSRIVPGDWNSVAHAIARLDARLNTDSSPIFSSVGLTGLTENALMYANGDGALTSLSAATNGQLIIGSTGVVPSVVALTGTANQIIVTNGAGSITLSLNAAITAHLHDTHTLQHDAVNSDGGAFSFTTTGLVTFNQSIASANYTAANLLTACATNAGALDFSAASKTLTVENNAIVSQDYSADAIPIFAGLTPNADDTYDLGLVEEEEPEYSLEISQTLENSSETVSTINWAGTSFTPATGFNLARVDFWMLRDPGGTGNVTLHLTGTDGGLPDGEDDLASATIDGTTISDDTWGWVTFVLETPYTLTQDVVYAVYVSATTAKFNTRYQFSNEYAGGQFQFTSDSGGTWYNLSGRDGTFRIYSSGETEYTYTRWRDLYLSGLLHDGTVSLSVANAKAAYDFTTALDAATDGQLMIGDTDDNPVLATLTGTGNQITVTGGAGSITLSTPQDIHSRASPTFAGGTFTGTVAGIDPTASNHLATKEYVDSAISFINDFFLTDDASIGGYFDAAESPTGAATGTVTTEGLTEGDDKPLDGFVTESGFPGVTTLMAGTYNMHFHAQRSAGNRDYAIYFELWTRTDPGGAETLRATSETSANFDDDNENAITVHASIATDVVINATDRLVWKLFANMGVGNNTDLGILTEGVTNSHVSVPTTTEVLSSVFVRRDGTTELSANWGVGDFDITGIGALGSGAITSSGASTFNSGSVDADFTVNWNTGVGLFVQGSDGRVGAGTGSPNAPLEVKGAKPAGNIGGFQSGMLHVTGTGTAQFSNSVITGHSAYNTNTQLWYLGSMTDSNDNIAFINRQNAAMCFLTNNADRMIIDASGNVGIGLITVDANYKLIIRRAANINLGIGLQSSELAIAAFNDALSANIPMRFYASEYNFLNGKVGINTTTPVSQLSINGGLHVGGDSDAGDNNLLVDGTVGCGVLFLTEQANAEADVAGKGQLWVKNAVPNTLWFTDDAGYDHKLRMAAHTETINLLDSDSSAQKQAKIDAIPKYIPAGVSITFQFEINNTHVETVSLSFSGFYGGGIVWILGDNGEAGANTLHTTQNTIIDFATNSVNGITITGCRLAFIIIQNLKVIVPDVQGFSGIHFNGCFGAQLARSNYIQGSGITTLNWGVGSANSLASYCETTYVSNVNYGIWCSGGNMTCTNNDDTGTQPKYGLSATYLGTIGKFGTVPAGSTANEFTERGGVIRA